MVNHDALPTAHHCCGRLSVRDALASVRVLPLRMELAGVPPEAGAALVRSVWGKALHDHFPEVYAAVFRTDGAARGADGRVIPGRSQPYVLDLEGAADDATCELRFVLVGDAARHEAAALRAWSIASQMGLGRDRIPFEIRDCTALGSDGRPTDRAGASAAWPLSEALWPLSGDPDSTPCALRFVSPLRLLTRDGAEGRGDVPGDDARGTGAKRLVTEPTYAQIVGAALRRVESCVTGPIDPRWRAVLQELETLARRQPAGEFRGHRGQVERWSTSQQAELEFRGVCGTMPLPYGPGPFWPALAAALWLGLGKNTTHGLGALRIARG